MSSDLKIRFSVRNILKLLLLFKHKGLLVPPLYLLLKESVLGGTDDHVFGIFEKYDLNVLSDPDNFRHLQRLFDILQEYAIEIARKQLDQVFDEANLMAGHQISNQSSIEAASSTNNQHKISSSSSSSSSSSKSSESDDSRRGLVYGEVEFDSFQKVMETALTGLQGKSGKFTDLGSGTGKACLWVALTTSFRNIVGIELLQGLYDISNEALVKFLKANHMAVNPADDDMGMFYNDNNNNIEFIKSSFLEDEYDWSDSDLVFANSTCFPEDLMMKLSVRSQVMSPKSRFITFTVSLDSPYWRVIYKERLKMSWGFATVFVHERLTDDEAIRVMREGSTEDAAEEEGGESRWKVDDGVWLSSGYD